MSRMIDRRLSPVLGMTLVLCSVLFAASAQAQALIPMTLEKGSRLEAAVSSRPFSNAGVELLTTSDSIWFGGGKGLELTTDGGNSWEHFGDVEPFNNPSYVPPLYMDNVSALKKNGAVMWTALAGTYVEDDLPQGLGLAVSTDDGATWTHFKQPRENQDQTYYTIPYGNSNIQTLAVTTDVQNITYDLAITKDAVWTANFAGGLRKSTDGGNTWQVVVLPPDHLSYIHPDSTYDFDISPVGRTFYIDGDTITLSESLNHRVFSVMATDDETIWVGTAGGINLTTDGGESWKKFSYTDANSPISGNFVIAFAQSFYQGKEYIWASTINAQDQLEYRAISYTTNRGETWTTALRGEFTNNFAVKDSIVYALTRTGIYRTANGGQSWTHFSQFVDTDTREQITSTTCYAGAAVGDYVWISTADGLMRTKDTPAEMFGTNWDIFRAYQESATPATAYAYPNPFSPDDEVCRIHYKTGSMGSVTIKVFDYAMFPVRTVVQNGSRTPNMEHEEIWDGKTDNGNRPANGVYYIQVDTGDSDAAWAKIIVLQ